MKYISKMKIKYFANIESIKRILRAAEEIDSDCISLEVTIDVILRALIESEARILILERKISDLENIVSNQDEKQK